MADESRDNQPSYDRGQHNMLAERGPLARDFARQILDTTAPFCRKAAPQLDVLDVGCGYGHTAIELARQCARVVGIEPSRPLWEFAASLREEAKLPNVEFCHEGLYDHYRPEAYDLIVLDNVFEHLPDQPRALEILSGCLREGGVLYLLLPNKLWPVEVHYRLPLLSYLPLRLANAYLRLTGRGEDYSDASYAPTYFSLNRMLRARPELSYRYVLPAHLALTHGGKSLHYALGAAMIRRIPWFWAISKAFLIVAVKGAMP